MSDSNSSISGNDDSRQKTMERLRAARLRIARGESGFKRLPVNSNTSLSGDNNNKSNGKRTYESINPLNDYTNSNKIARSDAPLTSSSATVIGPSSSNNSNSSSTSQLSTSISNNTHNNNNNTPQSSTENKANGDQHRKANRPSAFSKKFDNYIEYDFSKMQDTKGGFLTEESTMTPEEIAAKRQREMEERRRELKLGESPVMAGGADTLKCFECGTENLDFKLYNVFKCRVCKICARSKPEKYSLLTKTECKEDYLLTDPELRDTELLPHWDRPNPYKSTFTNMMLYLRYQAEEVAFKKWGGPEQLDAEYQRRLEAKKNKKDKKFVEKLQMLRKRTKVSGAYANDTKNLHHVHEWSAGLAVSNAPAGTVRRRCATCGMETEEILM